MFGRPAASQIASASAASFLFRFTYALTYLGGIRRTSWPSVTSSRAQWCAVGQASIATVQGGSPEKKARSWPRRTALRRSTVPEALTPCSWKTCLAKSRPIIVICSMGGSLLEVLGGPHLAHRCRKGAIHLIRPRSSPGKGSRSTAPP